MHFIIIFIVLVCSYLIYDEETYQNRYDFFLILQISFKIDEAGVIYFEGNIF